MLNSQMSNHKICLVITLIIENKARGSQQLIGLQRY